MHLRKSLVAVAAIVAAGLLGLSGTANAATGSFTGYFKSGNATFAGSTYGCSSGSISGTYDTIGSPALRFSTVTLNCSTPVGTATVSVTPAGCPGGVAVNLPGPTRTSGIDTSIAGTAVMGTGTCVKVSGLGGLCTANSQGTIGASYNETVSGVNDNEITFSGTGSLANQSGCLGLWSGNYTLNNFTFGIAPALNFV